MGLLAARLRAMGVPCETLFIPYAQHAFDFVVGGFSDQILEAELLKFLRAGSTVTAASGEDDEVVGGAWRWGRGGRGCRARRWRARDAARRQAGVALVVDRATRDRMRHRSARQIDGAPDCRPADAGPSHSQAADHSS